MEDARNRRKGCRRSWVKDADTTRRKTDRTIPPWLTFKLERYAKHLLGEKEYNSQKVDGGQGWVTDDWYTLLSIDNHTHQAILRGSNIDVLLIVDWSNVHVITFTEWGESPKHHVHVYSDEKTTTSIEAL